MPQGVRSLHILLKLIDENLDLMLFTSEPLSFAVEVNYKCMPVLINFLVIVIYLQAVIDDVNDYAEGRIVRFISLIDYLEECHSQGASI